MKPVKDQTKIPINTHFCLLVYPRKGLRSLNKTIIWVGYFDTPYKETFVPYSRITKNKNREVMRVTPSSKIHISYNNKYKYFLLDDSETLQHVLIDQI